MLKNIKNFNIKMKYVKKAKNLTKSIDLMGLIKFLKDGL